MPENNNEEVRTESGESNSKETGYGLLALAGVGLLLAGYGVVNLTCRGYRWVKQKCIVYKSNKEIEKKQKEKEETEVDG